MAQVAGGAAARAGPTGREAWTRAGHGRASAKAVATQEPHLKVEWLGLHEGVRDGALLQQHPIVALSAGAEEGEAEVASLLKGCRVVAA